MQNGGGAELWGKAGNILPEEQKEARPTGKYVPFCSLRCHCMTCVSLLSHTEPLFDLGEKLLTPIIGIAGMRVIDLTS